MLLLNTSLGDEEEQKKISELLHVEMAAPDDSGQCCLIFLRFDL